MKKEFEKNRRAEMTTEQIVILIVLITSFAVILFFLIELNFGQTTDQQVCHNSVVERGSGVIPTGAIPLDCKTHYLCLSKDGTCKEMTAPDIVTVKNKNDVYQALANEMAECWWEFGEGKLNYVGSTFTSNLYCSICSQVAFDKSINFFNNGQIDEAEFYNYLAVTNDSGQGTTYLNYLLGLKNAQVIQATLEANRSSFGTIDLNKQYFVVMGIFSKVGLLGWAAVGAGAGAGIAVALVLSPVTGGATLASIPGIIIISSGIVGGVTGGYMIGTAVNGESGHEYLSPTIVEANSNDFNSLKCASIQTLS